MSDDDSDDFFNRGSSSEDEEGTGEEDEDEMAQRRERERMLMLVKDKKEREVLNKRLDAKEEAQRRHSERRQASQEHITLSDNDTEDDNGDDDDDECIIAQTRPTKRTRPSVEELLNSNKRYDTGNIDDEDIKSMVANLDETTRQAESLSSTRDVDAFVEPLTIATSDAVVGHSQIFQEFLLAQVQPKMGSGWQEIQSAKIKRRGEPFSITQSLASLQLRHNDVIILKPINGAQSSQPAPPKASVPILNITIRCEVDGMDKPANYDFRCRETDKLEKSFVKFCEAMGKDCSHFKFTFDGHRLQGDETPKSLDMEDEDMIDAMRL